MVTVWNFGSKTHFLGIPDPESPHIYTNTQHNGEKKIGAKKLSTYFGIFRQESPHRYIEKTMLGKLQPQTAHLHPLAIKKTNWRNLVRRLSPIISSWDRQTEREKGKKYIRTHMRTFFYRNGQNRSGDFFGEIPPNGENFVPKNLLRA